MYDKVLKGITNRYKNPETMTKKLTLQEAYDKRLKELKNDPTIKKERLAEAIEMDKDLNILLDAIFVVETKSKGLFSKYNVSKTDGAPIDFRAMYFVLRYDFFARDKVHIKACRKALHTYTKEIKDHLPILAKQLNDILRATDFKPLPQRPE